MITSKGGDDDFKKVVNPVPECAEGHVLVKNEILGFDPALKGWMENIADYVAPMAIGEVMRGSAISEVLESNGGKFSAGDVVMGSTGWSEFNLSDGEGLTKVDTELSPTTMLSVLGTTGVTAYCGLFKVGKPVAGDTVVVSGAAGATGSIVGQFAKLAGCRVVGIAGGPEKCKWLVDEAGYDAAIDYKAGGVKAQLKEHCPKGIDVIFDNVRVPKSNLLGQKNAGFIYLMQELAQERLSVAIIGAAVVDCVAGCGRCIWQQRRSLGR